MAAVSPTVRVTTNNQSLKSNLLSKQVQFSLDLIVLFGAFVFAYLLRFDFSIPSKDFSRALGQIPIVIGVQLAVLYFAGVYKFIWRYVGLAEAKRIVFAAIASAVPLILLRLLLSESWQSLRIPLSVIMMDSFLAFAGVLLIRVARRDAYERNNRKAAKRTTLKRRPVLLIGAGRAGVATLTEIRARADSDLVIKGFIDDDVSKRGLTIQGVKVLGTTADLPELVKKMKIDHVVISITQASRQDFRRILDVCRSIQVNVRIIPCLYEVLQGKVKVSRIRDVEVEDLLGRTPVKLDEASLTDFLGGKVVMITGAGGSIGSELSRQLARFNPGEILLVERAECALFNIDRELRSKFPELQIYPMVADITDEIRMRAIFAEHRPQVLLHAAAHKHVPMMESNTAEAVKNNVLGTRLLGELAGEFNLETFVLISTDKAVKPTSVMGATKRIAELVVQDLDARYDTRYVAVRFGNVIGSAGSVIPIFREQILNGGPVTVTHPDMVRYFMTIPEASQLVLQAGAMGGGGEIFILNMGEPVRILDLAKQTILLSGLRPHEDIDIVFTGVRPGEKLFEELDTADEELIRTLHPKIFIGKISAYPSDVIQQALHRLTVLARKGWSNELRSEMNRLLPEGNLEVSTQTVSRFEDVIHSTSNPPTAMAHAAGS
jgi:FlaA1/EpsC-like NDP-sugar epimerase